MRRRRDDRRSDPSKVDRGVRRQRTRRAERGRPDVGPVRAADHVGRGWPARLAQPPVRRPGRPRAPSSRSGPAPAGRHRPDVLAAERAALVGGVVARVHRGRGAREGAAGLAVVGEVEARAVAAAHVQGAIGPERHGADRVARELLAPVVDQDLFGPALTSPLAWNRDSRPLTTHPSVVGPGGVGQPSFQRGALPPIGRVVRVQDVDVRVGREVGGERHAQQAAVPVVVDLALEVGERDRGRVGQAVEDLDRPALLGDEDPAVLRELDDRRVDEPAQDGLVLEACRDRGGQRGRLAGLCVGVVAEHRPALRPVADGRGDGRAGQQQGAQN